jgi:hypothetical protein
MLSVMPDMSETLPQFVSVSRYEQGNNLGISHSDYRSLARTWLCIVRDLNATTAASRLPGESGCCVHIWTRDRYLIITVDSSEQELGLFLYADLDAPDDPACIFTGSNSTQDWQLLKETGKEVLRGQ